MFERLKLWLYYNRLAWRDLLRLWPTTQHHVIIVAGICLPILLLLGLKRGHVADLRRELLTSPTGRQVVFWSAQNGELLDAPATERLERELPGVELIIPEQERVVRIHSAASPDDINATLYSTVANDPILKQVGAVLNDTEVRSIVLSYAIAKRLQVAPGDALTLTVDRRRDGLEESVKLDVRLHAVLPNNGDQQSSIGYADRRLLDNLEQYVRGFRVEAFQWPALKAAVRDKYSAYFAFCETGSDYHEADLDLLKERGLIVSPLDDDLTLLFGAINPARLDKLRVYKIASVSSESDPLRRLILAPSDISELTAADDVILPWNAPHTWRVGDTTLRLVGLSLPQRCWLREYLLANDLAFTYDVPTFSVRFLTDNPLNAAAEKVLSLPLVGGNVLSLAVAPWSLAASKTSLGLNANGLPNAPTNVDDVEPESATGVSATPSSAKPSIPVQESKPTLLPSADHTASTADTGNAPTIAAAPGPVTVVVPADLLAQLDAFHNGSAEYDPVIGMFVPRAESPIYGKARAYAFTIDTVPAVVSALSLRGFAVESQNSRIMEIHDQDHSLQILVWVVGIGVFLFGIVTTVSVLSDSTDRKRGTIGILRVMGVSKWGVFYVTVLRAAVIGLLAGIMATGVGYGLAWLLRWNPPSHHRYLAWKPQVTVLLDPLDLGMVFIGALICSGLGAILPAWKASRLDPFDAIIEGRFR